MRPQSHRFRGHHLLGHKLDQGHKAILLDGEQTIEKYLELISQGQHSRESWGGESELHAMVILWKCVICTLLLRTDPVDGSQMRLVTAPLGMRGPIHTLLFNGTHYDLVILTQDQWLH